MKNQYKLSKLRLPWKLSFSEDLCDVNVGIRDECARLKDAGEIEHFIVRNGFVKVFKKNQSSGSGRNRKSRPIKVNHPRDLQSIAGCNDVADGSNIVGSS